MVEELGEAKGELIRFLAPRTVDALARKLPIEGRAALWKSEVYFEVPLNLGDEKAKDTAEKGRIAYWPMGRAFCIFYDKTRPYSSVNLIGKVTENLEIFSQVKSGTKIRIERI
ncbi:MAG: cyclophilin-like fold protein [Candidatus Bathyarchaeota archaeon]|nr:cyclophilin-like fold protein [Candidatus Bathyarchaeota archaeon]